MQYLLAALLAVPALAQNLTLSPTVVTGTVTTFCSEPTTIVTGSATFVVPTSGLVTLTNCPISTSTLVPVMPTLTTLPVYPTGLPSNVTTTVVTALTTYCPTPGLVSVGSKTYTITKATTLTITDCPCTITKPVVPAPAPPATNAPGVPPSVSAPVGGPTAVPPKPYTTAVVPVPPATPVATSPARFTGGASVNGVQGVAAALGLAAWIFA